MKAEFRKEKRWLRKHGMLSPVYEAFNLGSTAAAYPTALPPRLRINPYPPGRRHSEWERGYKVDPDAGE